MLTRIHGAQVFECDACDACGDTLETETKDFKDALRIMRDANWRARQIGQDWVHTCFGCQDEADRNRSARDGGRIP